MHRPSGEIAPGRKPRPTGPRPAFSLVELLVSITVLGVLVGVMLPTLARAVASEQRLRCASALRQLQTALVLYCGDRDAPLPTAGIDPLTDDWGLTPLNQTLEGYGGGDLRLWECPAARRVLVSDRNGHTEQSPSSYLYTPATAPSEQILHLASLPAGLPLLADARPYHLPQVNERTLPMAPSMQLFRSPTAWARHWMTAFGPGSNTVRVDGSVTMESLRR